MMEDNTMVLTGAGNSSGKNALLDPDRDTQPGAADGSPAFQQMGFFAEDVDDGFLDECEEVSSEFFNDTKEPCLTLNVNQVYPNATCVRMLPGVEYVRILVNRERKALALEPSNDQDIKAYRRCREKDGKRYGSHRTGPVFVLMICKMMGWDPDYRYNIRGKLIRSKGKLLMAFDLMEKKCYPKKKAGDTRKTAFPIESWNGRFGPTYSESRRSLHMDTFDGVTIWTIKEGDLSGGGQMPDKEYSESGALV